MMHPEEIERLSRAVSLTVFELDCDRNVLVPAYLLANLMSPALWRWRSERRATSTQGTLRSCRSRLKALERHFHLYTFTHFEELPGGDPWGLLSFDEEAERLGRDYIGRIRREYDAALRKLLAQNPASQFGRIVNEPFYAAGRFPRLRNETVEVMDAYGRITPDGKGSGKCAALAMLWAAALIAWGRFPAEKITVVGNRSHVFVYLDEEDGHLFNNTKWFSRKRIHNCSDLSELVRMVTTSTETTFFYNPAHGFCHCGRQEATFLPGKIFQLYDRLHDFLDIPLKTPDTGNLQFISGGAADVGGLTLTDAETVKQQVSARAARHPGSPFEFALYAHRLLEVTHPEVYLVAALRDPQARTRARQCRTLEDVLKVVEQIPGKESIFGCRDRIALPDEVLLFRTGSDRDRALLLFALLHHWRSAHASTRQEELAVLFTPEGSFVRRGGQWINVEDLTMHDHPPEGGSGIAEITMTGIDDHGVATVRK